MNATPESAGFRRRHDQDPIVEEVRSARDAIAKEHGYELEAIFAVLRELEKRRGREHVTLPPRKVAATVAEGALTEEVPE